MVTVPTLRECKGEWGRQTIKKQTNQKWEAWEVREEQATLRKRNEEPTSEWQSVEVKALLSRWHWNRDLQVGKSRGEMVFRQREEELKALVRESEITPGRPRWINLDWKVLESTYFLFQALISDTVSQVVATRFPHLLPPSPLSPPTAAMGLPF